MTFDLSDELVNRYTCLVTSWLKKMICRSLASSIDMEQLASTIVFDLDCFLRKTDANRMEHDELVRICRTITKRRVEDEIRFARRRKRMLPAQNDARLELNAHFENNQQLTPEQQVELDDFIAVLLVSLDAKNRRIVKFKRLGWSNEQIASELQVSVRTVQSRYEKIKIAFQALQNKSDRPSTINHQPSTRNPKPETRNPKPETRNCSSFKLGKRILIFSFDSTSRIREIVDLGI